MSTTHASLAAPPVSGAGNVVDDVSCLPVDARFNKARGVVSDTSFAYKGTKPADQHKNTGFLKVRERYVRDDVPCGVPSCSSCQQHLPSGAAHVSPGPQSSTAVCIVTVDVLLFFLPLLELSTSHFRFFVVFQTDLVHFRKLATSAQLKALRIFLERTDIVVHVFNNQSHCETAVTGDLSMQFKDSLKERAREKRAGESLDDGEFAFWGDIAATFRTWEWYAQHLGKAHIRCDLLCRSDILVELFRSSSTAPKAACVVPIDATFVKKYCVGKSGLSSVAATALDLFETCANQEKLKRAEVAAGPAAASRTKMLDGVLCFVDEPNLTRAEITRRIKGGKYVSGTLQVKTRKTWQAYVKVSSGADAGPASLGGQDVFIPSRELQGRALHGDVVAVQLLAKADWEVDASDVYSDGDASHGKSVAGAVPTGRVVAVLRRNPRQFIATILESSDTYEGHAGASHVLAVPLNPRLPKVRIRTSQRQALTGHRIVVAIDGWEDDSTYPEGHYISDLGPCGQLDTELRALMIEEDMVTHLLQHSQDGIDEVQDWVVADSNDGSEASVDAAKDAPETRNSMDSGFTAHDVPERKLFEASDRMELRTVEPCQHGSSPFFVFSVDPNGCTDIDDAMSIRQIIDAQGNKTYELGVHIADVSSVIRRDSQLDLEARRRATTLYFPDRRLDMIPSVLSADICSLLPKRDRCAVTVFFELDNNFDVVRTRKKASDADDEGKHILRERVWQGRTAIRSEFALTYSQAHRLLRGGPADPDPTQIPQSALEYKSAGTPVPREDEERVRNALRWLTKVAERRCKVRESHGALQLASNQLEFELENDNKNAPRSPNADLAASGTDELMATVDAVHSHEHLPIMDVVAELMIMANSAVAERIYSAFPGQAILRCHNPPPLEQLVELEAAADALIQRLPPKSVSADQIQRLKFSTGSNRELQQFLETVDEVFSPRRTDSIDVTVGRRFLHVLAVSCMSEAKYVCAGATEYGLNQQRESVWVNGETNDSSASAASSVNWQRNGAGNFRFGHYGLAVEFYTHFTSPIRRYADVLVHRCLIEGGVMGGAAGYVAPSVAAALARPAAVTTGSDGGGARLDPDAVKAAALYVGVESIPPFGTEAMHDMCAHLNSQTRTAKSLNRSVNELFLSLLCARRPLFGRAIVSGLRQNGLVVYVPEYNKKGVVYLTDADGNFLRNSFRGLLVDGTSTSTRSDGSQSSNFEDADASDVGQGEDHFPASAVLNEGRTELVVSSTCLKGGEVRFVVHSTVHVRLTCTFSPRSPRPSQIRIELEESTRVPVTDESFHDDALHDEPGKLGSERSAASTSSSPQKHVDGSVYSIIHRYLESVEASRGQPSADEVTRHAKSDTPKGKHEREVLHNMGHFRFGQVKRVASVARSRESASLGFISHDTR